MKKSNTKKTEGNLLEVAFGNVLRGLRQERGFSQERLGLESGYNRTYIGLLERGMKSPSLQTIFKLAMTLKIEPNELIRKVQSEHKELFRKKEIF